MVTLGSIVTSLSFLCLLGAFFSVNILKLKKWKKINLAFSKAFGFMDLELQRFEQLNGTDFSDWSQLKVRRVNKDRKFVGNITVHTALLNFYEMEFQFYKKQGGGYRLLPYRIPKKAFCDTFRDDVYFYPELVAASDFEMPPPCPIKKVTNSSFSCELLLTFIIYRASTKFEVSLLP